MFSRRRLTLLTILTGTTLTFLVLLATQFSHEPTYRGLTIKDWLSSPYNVERSQALLVIGTNNLPLLIRRIAYDPTKDRIIALYCHLPRQLRRQTWFHDFVARKNALADDAQGALEIVGPHASAAIPQLTKVANASDQIPARRALAVLDSIGEQGWTNIISLIHNTNYALRATAIRGIAAHTNSIAVRQALTNALQDSNPQIRNIADDILAGREPDIIRVH